VFEWTWVLDQINQFTLEYGDPVLRLGLDEWAGILAANIIIYSIKWADRSEEESISGFKHLITLAIVSLFMLHYYSTPFPAIGNDFKHLIPDMATSVANIIEQSRYDQAMHRVTHLIDHLEQPNLNFLTGAIDAHAIIAYGLVELSMVFLGSLLMIPIGLSFIALAIGSVMWPLFIPWMMVPRMSWLFWSPLNYIIKYSFYRVWAVALTYIIAGICSTWLDHVFKLDMTTEIAGKTVEVYSLAQVTGMTMIGLVFLLIMSLIAIFELGNMLRDYFGGGAGAGSNLIGTGSSIISAGRSFA
jgi:hypothetical protein